MKGTEEECCPKHTCMPEALPLIKGAPALPCPSVRLAECGEFQEMKTVTGPDNCPRYVCGKHDDNLKLKICSRMLVQNVCPTARYQNLYNLKLARSWQLSLKDVVQLK